MPNHTDMKFLYRQDGSVMLSAPISINVLILFQYVNNVLNLESLYETKMREPGSGIDQRPCAKFKRNTLSSFWWDASQTDRDRQMANLIST